MATSAPQPFALPPTVVRADDKLEALLVPEPPALRVEEWCRHVSFLAFVRAAIDTAEGQLGLATYQLRLCTTPQPMGAAPPGRKLGLVKLEGIAAEAAAASGCYVLLAGDSNPPREAPRALAFEAMDSTIEYEDASGLCVALDLCQRDLLVSEGEHARVFLDAQGRPMYVATLKRFVRRQAECSDAELAELWRLPLEQAAQCGGLVDARVNAGGYQNVAHLHLKCWVPPSAFEEAWAGSTVYQRLVEARAQRQRRS